MAARVWRQATCASSRASSSSTPGYGASPASTAMGRTGRGLHSTCVSRLASTWAAATLLPEAGLQLHPDPPVRQPLLPGRRSVVSGSVGRHPLPLGRGVGRLRAVAYGVQALVRTPATPYWIPGSRVFIFSTMVSQSVASSRRSSWTAAMPSMSPCSSSESVRGEPDG